MGLIKNLAHLSPHHHGKSHGAGDMQSVWKVGGDAHRCRCGKGGGKSPPAQDLKSFEEVILRLTHQVDKEQISGRYHRFPRTLEHDYKVTETVLGTGVNGEVKLATSKINPNHVFAVKAFHFAGVPPGKRAQLESEIELFLCMDHPHIARLTDVYESDEHLDLVMECMQGGELFDRIKRKGRFSERSTAEACWQMLLALNYIHDHGIMHGDVKLENFMYDSNDSDHIKLIDFGFSKMRGQTAVKACGTLSYIAPEVLDLRFSSQADQWSLGVIVFVLLSGRMPFFGDDKDQKNSIRLGSYVMKPELWCDVSTEAIDFTRQLLQVNPTKRLTSQRALEHPFIMRAHHEVDVDPCIVEALRDFGHQSNFRRCCLSLMAWSLSYEERAQVEEYFIAMDVHHHGAITYGDLKQIMCDKFHLPGREVKQTFEALSIHHDKEIHFSDFLAAMVSTRIEVTDELLREAFRKFDTDDTGFITVDDLRVVLGDKFNGERVEQLHKEVSGICDVHEDDADSWRGFVAFMLGVALTLWEVELPRVPQEQPL
eukprot:CAMPEP_0178428868 /NCGR_PEP_ID=MMETSP0689_2-20121128/30506_1 /TAXON_ID=160604 /ORGANISM="Amphidinium massartii, Strain CS-259" /LENGTH=539 /DNA_ID=CAMNT_0020050667 /DNA_START=67 /DNA_END=1686 /DNA_ORIENTATION=-